MRNRMFKLADHNRVGILVGGLLIVGAVYLGQNPKNKRTSPPTRLSGPTSNTTLSPGTKERARRW